jgi:hypothetical protein
VIDRRRQDGAVFPDAEAHGGVLVAGLAGGEQVFATVLDPLDGCGDPRSREHEAKLLAQRHDLLPEPATRVAHDDSYSVLGDPEDPRTDGSDLVGGLGGCPDRHRFARRVPLDDHAPRLYGNR